MGLVYRLIDHNCTSLSITGTRWISKSVDPASRGHGTMASPSAIPRLEVSYRH